MRKVIYIESESELRELLDLQNTEVKDGDEIVFKKDITLSNNLAINKEINIVFSNGSRLSTGEYELQFDRKCNFH